MKWYIGWDAREPEAYRTCVSSLTLHSLPPIEIIPLKHRELRKRNLFWREWRIDGAGQYWDVADGRPFSTEFAFTRFLVPELARDSGDEWAFFVDADFVFVEDTSKIELDPSKAVMVVKHNYWPKNAVKMDGMQQTSYPCKNWSSLIAFNLKHPSNRKLTLEAVNTASGFYLHSFGWLEGDEIGELDPAWNWLVGHSPSMKPKAYHFTNGGPWFDDWQGGPDDHVWERAYREMRANYG